MTAASGLPDTTGTELLSGTLTGPVSVSQSAAAGGILTVVNSHTTPTSPTVQYSAQTAADLITGLKVTGDTQYRLTIDSNGKMSWGPGGSTATDTNLYRAGAGSLKTDNALTAQAISATGLTGVGATGRYVGTTTGGPPNTGTFAVGDFCNDSAGMLWSCVSAGSPGNWNAAGGNDYYATQALAVGETVLPRQNVGNGPALTSGKVQFSYFTAQKTEVCTQLGTLVANIAAGATPTVCQAGLYSVDTSGNLTSVAITANDTTLWAATFTQYNRTVTTFTKVAGQRYAFAILCVSAAAMPSFYGYNGTVPFSGLAPIMIRSSNTGQSALLSSYAVGALVGTSSMYTGLVSP